MRPIWKSFKYFPSPVCAALDNPEFKTPKRVMVTNNLHATNRMGEMSHVWLASPMESSDPAEGPYMAFTDGNRRLFQLTHWMDPFVGIAAEQWITPEGLVIGNELVAFDALSLGTLNQLLCYNLHSIELIWGSDEIGSHCSEYMSNSRVHPFSNDPILQDKPWEFDQDGDLEVRFDSTAFQVEINHRPVMVSQLSKDQLMEEVKSSTLVLQNVIQNTDQIREQLTHWSQGILHCEESVSA